jgi:Chaperone for flagella basal body P-ring formation
MKMINTLVRSNLVAKFFARGVFRLCRLPFVAGIFLAFALTACAWGQISRPVFTPVTRDEVWQAVRGELRQRGVREEQMLQLDEIELPAAVPAAASRTLRVSMVCWDADLERAQFQLECREPGQCVPFLAYADAGRSTAMGSEKIAGSSCRSGSRPRNFASTGHKDMIRVGDRATVVFRGSRLNLTAAVTCLERGTEGAIVRVRNEDGQVFRARVSAPARLEALTP